MKPGFCNISYLICIWKINSILVRKWNIWKIFLGLINCYNTGLDLVPNFQMSNWRKKNKNIFSDEIIWWSISFQNVYATFRFIVSKWLWILWESSLANVLLKMLETASKVRHFKRSSLQRRALINLAFVVCYSAIPQF